MTIMGQHTIAEVEDLIKTKNYSVQQLTNAYLDFKAAWIAADPDEHEDWVKDWRKFIARYEEAIKYAKIRVSALSMANFVTPNNMIPCETAYHDILVACNRNYPANTYSKGDLQDLHNRISDARGRPVTYPNQPQPGITNDMDMNVHAAADMAVKGIENAASETVSSPYTWLALGTIGLGAFLVLRR